MNRLGVEDFLKDKEEGGEEHFHQNHSEVGNSQQSSENFPYKEQCR